MSRRVREHEVVHSAPQLVPNDGVAAEQSRRVRLEGTHSARRPAPSEPLKIGTSALGLVLENVHLATPWPHHGAYGFVVGSKTTSILIPSGSSNPIA